MISQSAKNAEVFSKNGMRSSNFTNNIEEKTEEKDMVPCFTLKDVKWKATIKVTSYHIVALYGLLTFPYIELYKTTIWGFVVAQCSLFGISVTVHRYYSHKAFKANVPLRIILAFCYLLTFQIKISEWVKIHRAHHRYSDTYLDPHSVKRGFFFSHIGWRFLKYTPEVKKIIEGVDLSDVKADPVAVFVDKHFQKLAYLAQMVTIIVPVYFWNEDLYFSVLIQFVRLIYVVHVQLAINSFSHMYGNKPYNKFTKSTDNFITGNIFTSEYFHNYHHAFPYDYRMSEWGMKVDFPAMVIKLFSLIGWAYDLQIPSDELIQMTVERKGNKHELRSMY